MDEGGKRVLAIVAGILVARHLKSTEDLFDNRASPRTEAMVAAAVQWAESIGNQNLRDRQIESIVVIWLRTDANRATAWLANSSLSAETKARLLSTK